MVGPADKQTLLGLMELRRAAWDALISMLGEHRLSEPGADGDWSVKDVIAHIAAYEDWTAEQIESSSRGETPDLGQLQEMGDGGWYDVDTRNRRTYEANKHKPLEQVMDESEKAFNRLLQAVEATPEENLARPQWWTQGQPLINVVPAQSFEHYDQHIGLIKLWLAGQRGVEATHLSDSSV